MKKFNDEQLSRVLSHVGEMSCTYTTGPGCLVQTALCSSIGQNDQYQDAEKWFDFGGGDAIASPDELLAALEEMGLA